MPLTSRLLPLWSVEEQSACFVVRDHNGQAIAYVYLEDEPGAVINRQSCSHATRRCALRRGLSIMRWFIRDAAIWLIAPDVIRPNLATWPGS